MPARLSSVLIFCCVAATVLAEPRSADFSFVSTPEGGDGQFSNVYIASSTDKRLFQQSWFYGVGVGDGVVVLKEDGFGEGHDIGVNVTQPTLFLMSGYDNGEWRWLKTFPQSEGGTAVPHTITGAEHYITTGGHFTGTITFKTPVTCDSGKAGFFLVTDSNSALLYQDVFFPVAGKECHILETLTADGVEYFAIGKFTGHQVTTTSGLTIEAPDDADEDDVCFFLVKYSPSTGVTSYFPRYHVILFRGQGLSAHLKADVDDFGRVYITATNTNYATFYLHKNVEERAVLLSPCTDAFLAQYTTSFNQFDLDWIKYTLTESTSLTNLTSMANPDPIPFPRDFHCPVSVVNDSAIVGVDDGNIDEETGNLVQAMTLVTDDGKVSVIVKQMPLTAYDLQPYWSAQEKDTVLVKGLVFDSDKRVVSLQSTNSGGAELRIYGVDGEPAFKRTLVSPDSGASIDGAGVAVFNDGATVVSSGDVNSGCATMANEAETRVCGNTGVSSGVYTLGFKIDWGLDPTTFDPAAPRTPTSTIVVIVFVLASIVVVSMVAFAAFKYYTMVRMPVDYLPVEVSDEGDDDVSIELSGGSSRGRRGSKDGDDDESLDILEEGIAGPSSSTPAADAAKAKGSSSGDASV